MSEDLKIRKSLLGGFNREDVVAYIESLAKRSNKLKTDKDSLESKVSELTGQYASASAELTALRLDKHAVDEQLLDGQDELSRCRKHISELETSINELEVKNAELTKTLETVEAKAALYDAARERIADLELNASKRAMEIEKAADEKAAEISRRCNAYLAEVKDEYLKASAEAQGSFPMIITELGKLSERLGILSAFLCDKSEGFAVRFLNDNDEN